MGHREAHKNSQVPRKRSSGGSSRPQSLCLIYLGKERVFLSTSKENVRLCNTGDEENEAFEAFFFPFLEKSVVK